MITKLLIDCKRQKTKKRELEPVSEWLKNIKIITVIQINSWWVSCGRPVGQPVGNRDVVHRVVHGTIHSLSTTPIESKF
jgi:hypothetical protein